MQLGYCTNVHAGPDLAATKANLQKHALGVKHRVRPDEPMGIGLWLAAPAAGKLRGDGELEAFAAWLREAGLVPFTLNGFPYGDFHQPVVKHRVYHPTWHETARRDYTLDLIEIQHALLPEGMAGSISTLPIAWGRPGPSPDELARAAENLCHVADRLARLERDHGRLIYICLEPEPGCVLQYSEDVVRFFEEHLLPTGDEDHVRRHLRVCHDICHAAVMFEEQPDVLDRYRAAGIAVGKVQVSSAVHLSLVSIGPDDRTAALEQLAGFAEDRYLHQTVVQEDTGATTFYEDLPLALETLRHQEAPPRELRVHFHVPIYLDRFGLLETSQPHLRSCLEAAAALPDLEHFEVETYAWGVLPDELQVPELADGIAREMAWFEQAASSPAG